MKGIFFALIISLPISFAFGQQSDYWKDLNQDYLKGLELFEEGFYANAQQYFEQIMNDLPSNAELSKNAQYYHAICALELYHQETDELLIQFLEDHPHTNKSNNVNFQLGRYYFRRKAYKKVVEYMKEVDKYDLDASAQEELFFKLGYSYFVQRKLYPEYVDEALSLFYEVKSDESIYATLSTYYRSHILYKKGNYQSSLVGFESLADNPTLKGIVPYYVTQIYYLQEKYEELKNFAIPLLEEASTKRAPEIARMIGEAYYRAGDYETAIPYLQQFADNTNSKDDYDLYQLAYAQYQSGNLNAAVNTFQELATLEDELGQLCYYYLGDIFLQLDEKEKARISFKKASSVQFDEELSENALFNYAKLAYDLYDPYQEAIKSFELFIEKYPNSKLKAQAYEYLLDVYVNSKNYGAALVALEKIELNDLKLRAAYQKIAFSRGVELFNNHKMVYHEKDNKFELLQSSISFFEKSLTYPIDKELAARAFYWMAESYYKQGNFEKSIALYSKFKYSPAISGLSETYHVDYNMGYAYYKLGMKKHEMTGVAKNNELNEGIETLRKFTNAKSHDTIMLNDALIRIADAYFVQRNFVYAVDFYQKAIEVGKLRNDYSFMQMAQAEEVLGNDQNSIKALNSLVSTYPNSSYVDDAYFLLGETHFGLNELPEAQKFYKQLIQNHKKVNPQLIQTAHVRLALIAYQQDDYSNAITSFQSAIEMNPRNSISQQALEGIQEVYTKIGDSDSYFNWYGKLGLPAVSDQEKDNFLFEIGREQYLDNKFSEAIASFSTYLEQFPNGIHSLDVHYFKADCHLRLKQKDEALLHYDSVIASSRGDYTEDAVLQAARIHLEKKEWDQVIYKYLILEDVSDYYPNRMEARIGLMRAYFESDDKKKAKRYASIVAGNNKVPNEIKFEAHLTMGKCAYAMGDLENALEEFQTTVSLTKSEMGAEAKYHVAKIYFEQGKYDESKQTIIDLAKQIPAYKYWISKGYLLLSDNYLAKNDVFHAEHTLQIILENEENLDIRDEALVKLDEIRLMKEEEEILNDESDWDFDFEPIETDSLTNDSLKTE